MSPVKLTKSVPFAVLHQFDIWLAAIFAGLLACAQTVILHGNL